jgi:lysophospholipase L1-like esterase
LPAGRLFVLLIALLGAACGGNNPNPLPPPPPPERLALTCPAPVERDATGPEGVDVQFDLPPATGGQPPYIVACEPASGTVFRSGSTTVRCTATDSAMASASCDLLVTVGGGRWTLSRTRFMAFGDSITDGATTLEPLVMLAPSETYPSKLEQMLLQRYPTQTFVVSNQGKNGETAAEGATRLPPLLDSEKPEVVLLLEGVNAVWLLSTSRQADSIRRMIVSARQRDVEVILATLMPVSAEYDARRSPSLSRIRALNARIVDLAAEYRVGPVVDLYSLFEANMHLLGADGLHPTLEGQTRIAEAFRDEIVRRYEAKTTMTSGLLTRRDTNGR